MASSSEKLRAECSANQPAHLKQLMEVAPVQVTMTAILLYQTEQEVQTSIIDLFKFLTKTSTASTQEKPSFVSMILESFAALDALNASKQKLVFVDFSLGEEMGTSFSTDPLTNVNFTPVMSCLKTLAPAFVEALNSWIRVDLLFWLDMTSARTQNATFSSSAFVSVGFL